MEVRPTRTYLDHNATSTLRREALASIQEVLQGAADTLAHARPILCIHIDSSALMQHGSHPAELAAYLARLGYAPLLAPSGPPDPIQADQPYGLVFRPVSQPRSRHV